MKLYWHAQTRAFRAAWLLEEAGLEYELVSVDLHNPRDRANPEFRSASPMSKVPALIDGETRLWDSGAIALHIADRYPESGLGYGIEEPERGAFVQWVLYNNSVCEPAMVERFANAEPNPGRHGHGSFDQMIKLLVRGLGSGPWIMGERFTAADVLIGSGLNFMQTFGILPDTAPTLMDYATRCRERPAFGRARALDSSEPVDG